MAGKDKNSIKVKKSGDIYLKQVVAKDDENKKWDIKIEADDQEITFEEKKDGKISTSKLKIKISEHGKNVWQDAEAEIKCNKSIWRETYEIVPKILKTDGSTFTELKEVNKKLSTNVHSFGWGFYGAIVLGFLVVGGLIWWWISSSKSEDKEEESL